VGRRSGSVGPPPAVPSRWAREGDPLAKLAARELAEKLYTAGVREVTGDVTGLASRYGPELFPDGWTISTTASGRLRSAGSALTLNDNSVSAIVRPTENGELAELQLLPVGSGLIVQSGFRD